MEQTMLNSDDVMRSMELHLPNDLDYDSYVALGRKLVKKVEIYQCLIAMYACRVCTIRHGGISSKYYTLKDYALDIGLPVKRLQEWTSIYRNVIAKLDVKIETLTQDDWKVASRVNDNIRFENRRKNLDNKTPRKAVKYKPDFPSERIKKMFAEESKGPSFQTELRHWLTTVRSIKGKLLHRDLTLADEGNLLEMMNSFDEMSDHINAFLTKKRK